jgi:glycosyltransferase involved in cell wall biosynthesis
MQVAGAEVLVAETIRRLGRQLDPVVLCLDGVGQLGDRMQAEGVPVVHLGRRPGLDFSVGRRLAREIGERRLEIVHAHQYTPFFYTAVARPLVPRAIHVMFTEHGRHYPDVVSPRRRLLNRVLLTRAADEINAVCRFSADALAHADGFAARHPEVIENGIDIQKYGGGDARTARARLGLDPDRRLVACVARFHPVKDHAMLLRAFARVAAFVPDVDLLLAGTGPLRGALETQAAEAGIAARVKFVGVRDDVPEVLRAADVFTLTSISEAASLTLLEAMASERPVVVTNVGGNPEIVEDGVHGRLVPRGDDERAAEAIVRLLADPAVARAMGAAGRRRVEERYQLDRTIRAYHDRYRAAAERLRAGVRPMAGKSAA